MYKKNSPTLIFHLLASLGFALLQPGLAIAQFSNGQAAEVVLGQPDFTQVSPASGAARMFTPSDIFFDTKSEKLFVVDSDNNRVLRFATFSTGSSAEAVLGQVDLTSSSIEPASASSLEDPQGAFMDSAGHLWVADSGNNRVLRFDNAATAANGASASLVIGQTDFISDSSATAQDKLNFAEDIEVDSNGRLWIADSGNRRVLWFDNASSLSNAALANGVLGQSDFVSSLAATSQDGMSRPTGVSISGNVLWVADANNNRILRFDNASALTTQANANGVLGQTDFLTSAAAITATGFDAAWRARLDLQGTLWVTDYENDRVLGFANAASKANGGSADTVLGKPDFVTNVGTPSQTVANGPNDITFDSEGRLWVAEYSANRVVRYTHAPAQSDVSLSFRTRNVGSGSFGANANQQKLSYNFKSNKPRVRFHFFVENSSDTVMDSFRLQISFPRDSIKATAKFFVDGVDVTDKVVAGTLKLKSILPGASKEILARVRFNRSFKRKIREEIQLTARSVIDQTLLDVAKFRITRKRVS